MRIGDARPRRCRARQRKCVKCYLLYTIFAAYDIRKLTILVKTETLRHIEFSLSVLLVFVLTNNLEHYAENSFAISYLQTQLNMCQSEFSLVHCSLFSPTAAACATSVSVNFMLKLQTKHKFMKTQSQRQRQQQSPINPKPHEISTWRRQRQQQRRVDSDCSDHCGEGDGNSDY